MTIENRSDGSQYQYRRVGEGLTDPAAGVPDFNREGVSLLVEEALKSVCAEKDRATATPLVTEFLEATLTSGASALAILINHEPLVPDRPILEFFTFWDHKPFDPDAQEKARQSLVDKHDSFFAKVFSLFDTELRTFKSKVPFSQTLAQEFNLNSPYPTNQVIVFGRL